MNALGNMGDVEALLCAVRLSVELVGIARMALSEPPEGRGEGWVWVGA